jgi:hypothetical protein
MKLRYLILFLGIIVFSSFIFSNPIVFDYAQVRSTTYPVYMPYQYASYYDMIDLRYGVYGSSITAPVNVVVSPMVYGVNLLGQRIPVHNIQTHSFFLYPNITYTYDYNPMFYFDPNYQFYEVVLDLQSMDGSFSTLQRTYVYLEEGTTPLDPPVTPPQTTITCDDFSVSGFTDIYLEEDKRDFYKLYLINSIDKPFTITSVTTIPTSPQKLRIENINYPYTVSGYQTRHAQIDLFADTVSSNYSDNFDIKVVGNYNNLVCEKTYNVKYRIINSALPNNGNCNDIRILDKFFTINSNDNKNIEINIENKSLDYYFEIDDIRLDTLNNSIINSSLRNSIYRLFEDETKQLKVNLKSDKTNVYKTENLTLRIDGYLKRDNREDKRCRINETISVRVSPDSSKSSNECNGINIVSRDVSQKEQTKESYSINNGFYIFNNLNKKFIITGINYSDNSIYTSITSKAMNYNVFPKSSNSLNFDLSTSNVSSNTSAKGYISVEGYFENGDACSYSDIKSEFNILITDKNDICSQISLVDSYFKEGKNIVTIYNHSNIDFTVNDIISQNNHNVNVNVINKSFSLLKNSQKTIEVGVNGIGSFQLLAKGQFNDGVSCDYLQTTSGFYNYQEDYSFNYPSCDFMFYFPKNKYVYLDGDSINISFNNLTNKSGSIKLSSRGAVIEDPIIYFKGFENISRRIDLLNIKNPKEIEYIVDVYGCAPLFYKTNLYPYDLDFSGDVSFITYTSSISSIKNRLLSSLTLKNNSSESKDVEIKFSGFPNDFTFVVSDFALNLDLFTKAQHQNKITLTPDVSKNINFGVIVPLSAENKKYNGYIDVYISENLILKEQFTIDREIKKEPLLIKHDLEKLDEKKNKVLLTFNLKNELDIYRNLYLLFEDENSYSIEGDRNITIDPLSSRSISYNIEYDDNTLLKYKFIDADNDSVVFSGEINLLSAEQKPSFLTGFFSLSNIKGFFFYFILVLLIALIVYIVYYRYKFRPTLKKTKDTLPLKEDSVLEGTESAEIKIDDDTSSKQITLRELDGLEK